MEGNAKVQGGRHTVTYVIVPNDLADSLHDRMRRHFRRELSVEVIVERRAGSRRAGGERRTAEAQPEVERRQVRNADGRRVAERRGPSVEVAADVSLPDFAQEHAARFAFVQRVEPGSERSEDADSTRLVTRFQQQEPSVFEELYMRYFARVYTYLRVTLSDAMEAEAIAQRVFERVYELLPSYEVNPRQAFRAWLFALVREEAVGALCERSGLERSRFSAARAAQAHLYESPELYALDTISDRDVVFCIEDLPTAERQVLMLRYMLGLEAREIAAVLAQPVDDVRLLRDHATALLRERLPAVTKARRKGLNLSMV
jgi:RNA polymerase sigma-70 factor, ECF subfamily